MNIGLCIGVIVSLEMIKEYQKFSNDLFTKASINTKVNQ